MMALTYTMIMGAKNNQMLETAADGIEVECIDAVFDEEDIYDDKDVIWTCVACRITTNRRRRRSRRKETKVTPTSKATCEELYTRGERHIRVQISFCVCTTEPFLGNEM